MPGAGQAWLGRYDLAAAQFVYEPATFYFGYRLSEGEVFSLDGFSSKKLASTFRAPTGGAGFEHQLYGDFLQEFSLKSHMVNVYEAYVDAWKRSGGAPETLDTTSTLDLFKAPFSGSNLEDPWVWVPLAAVFSSTLIDYISTTQGTIPSAPRLTPPSNALYGFNYAVWQPVGSGAPEEMFYRGFLQNEFLAIVPSPYFSIPMSTLLFALSHAPGDGRYSAAIAGGYLGYLAHQNGGKLAKGITVHFWSSIILGLETMLLNQKGQRTTPPATLDLQVNF